MPEVQITSGYQLLPTKVYVQIARRCNLHCSMCGWKVWSRNAGVMDPEIFDRVVSECVRNDIRTIRFSAAQGEPFLNPHWYHYALKALFAGIEINFNTNITPLGRKNIDKLVNLATRFPGKLTIQCSFAGYDKASYEKTYAGADFEDTSRKLKALWEALGHTGIITIRGVIYDGNPEPHMSYLRSLGIPFSVVYLVVPDNFAGIVESVKPPGNVVPHDCYILRDHIGIYDNGDVTACGSRDSEGVMKLGNIMEQGLVELRSSPTYQSYVKAFADRNLNNMKLCKGCDLPR